MKGKDYSGTYSPSGIFIKRKDETKKLYWICECPICHKDFSVRRDHLINKPIRSCYECSSTQREDLTGQIFYYLRVDEMIYPEKYKRTKCSCTCLLCGATNVVVQANHLKSGETKVVVVLNLMERKRSQNY